MSGEGEVEYRCFVLADRSLVTRSNDLGLSEDAKDVIVRESAASPLIVHDGPYGLNFHPLPPSPGLPTASGSCSAVVGRRDPDLVDTPS